MRNTIVQVGPLAPFLFHADVIYRTVRLQPLSAKSPTAVVAIILTRICSPPIRATGRLFIDPIKLRAEYAAIVRSDRQGLGLGQIILEALIERGRQRGLSEVRGIVMRKNQAMLELASRLGLEIRRNPDDSGTNIVKKKLTAESD